MRLFSEHPLIAGLPIAAAIIGIAHLGFGAGLGAAMVTGLAAFLGVQIFAARIASRLDRRQAAQRFSALAKRVDGIESMLTAVQSELNGLAVRFEQNADQRNQRLVREMKMIEGLVSQLARNAASAPKAGAAPATAQSQTEGPPVIETVSRPIETLGEPELLEVIQSALEDNRIDLYLQPIVSLPQRKVKFYHGLARLRSLDGEVIEPAQYESLAVAQGFMPIIDNLLLFRCVQIVRRLSAKSARRGVFCRISAHSLSDADFFPQFLEFMRENVNLKELLVFELPHGTLDLAGTAGEANLEALGALGFSFALGAGEDVKLDLAWLRRRSFRFVKIAASLFLKSEGEPEAQILIDNFMTKLERQAIELIVDGIESEADVLTIVEHDVRLGEGLLFGGPRPIRRDLLDEVEEAHETAPHARAQRGRGA
jgi:cyclic-di-GMP phosphodiesterase TipF (flagellum assembly factor)